MKLLLLLSASTIQNNVNPDKLIIDTSIDDIELVIDNNYIISNEQKLDIFENNNNNSKINNLNSFVYGPIESYRISQFINILLSFIEAHEYAQNKLAYYMGNNSNNNNNNNYYYYYNQSLS